jgi:hypothetical protein
MDNVTFSIEQDKQGKLVLKRPGQDDVADVRIRRAFPWSHPERYISVRSAEGKELLLIEDLAAVPEQQRGVIREYLEKWAFIPRIQRVIEVDVRFGFQQWKVETDRGVAEFRVQEREDIRFLGDGRFSIKDVDGCIYEMPPLDQLDEKSRRAIEVLV